MKPTCDQYMTEARRRMVGSTQASQMYQPPTNVVDQTRLSEGIYFHPPVFPWLAH